MHDNEIELPSLNGARVLVAQNDQFIAADLDLMIDDAGGKVVALAANRDDALSLLGREPIDAAVVDPDLGDGEAASLIEALNQTRNPFRDLPALDLGPGFASAILTMGVGDRRGARRRSEADARLGADAVLVLKRPSRGPGAEPTPPAFLACSVPAPARPSSAPRPNRRCLVVDRSAALSPECSTV